MYPDPRPTYLVAMDRGVATVGGVSVVFGSTSVLHRVLLTTLQSRHVHTHTHTHTQVCLS